MKVPELLKLLEGKEDFDVILTVSQVDVWDLGLEDHNWPDEKDYDIELVDIGWSEKTIVLGIK